jgi:small subunit ribosomal protein S21
MLQVEVGKGGIDAALKKLKRKWDKTKMIKEVRSRKEFIKPTDKNRAAKGRAVYINKKYGSNE